MTSGLPGGVETWSLDGIIFNGAPDSNGVEYVMDVTGWSGSAARVNAHVQRPGGHGTYKQPSFYSGKPLGCTGWVYAPSTLLRRNAEDRIAALLSDGTRNYPLVCTQENGLRTAMVEMDDKVDVVLSSDESLLDFTFQLWQEDPRKSGDAWSNSTSLPTPSAGGLDWSTGGGLDWTGASTGGLDWGPTGSTGVATVHNSGTAPAWPMFTITGPTEPGGTLAGFSITNGLTGAFLFYDGLLGPGDVVTIDSSPYSRSVLLNGSADRRGYLGLAPWFTIEPGVDTPISFAGFSSSTSSTLTVSGTNEYW